MAVCLIKCLSSFPMVFILCAFNVLFGNHLCEGGRRQLKQRLVLLQLTSLKPETWGKSRKLQVGRGQVTELGFFGRNWKPLGTI